MQIGKRCTSPAQAVALVLTLFAVAGSASAGDVSYQVKASYIYNILQFVDFPSSLLTGDRVNVCILGEDRFGDALDEIDGSSTPSGRVNVRRLGRYGSDTRLTPCNLLYVVDSEVHAAERIMNRVDPLQTLTISEFDRFIEAGGMIELYQKDDNIRFRINATLAGRSDFKLDAQLVQLGVDVVDPEAYLQGGTFIRTLIASLNPIRRGLRVFS